MTSAVRFVQSTAMNTHREVIGRWPSRAQFASEVGVEYQTAKQWYLRDSIPGGYWLAVVDAAQKHGFEDITLDLLARIKADERGRSEMVA